MDDIKIGDHFVFPGLTLTGEKVYHRVIVIQSPPDIPSDYYFLRFEDHADEPLIIMSSDTIRFMIASGKEVQGYGPSTSNHG